MNMCEGCLELVDDIWFILLDEVIYMNICEGYFDVNDFWIIILVEVYCVRIVLLSELGEIDYLDICEDYMNVSVFWFVKCGGLVLDECFVFYLLWMLLI